MVPPKNALSLLCLKAAKDDGREAGDPSFWSTSLG
jgi:hypothetical protein